MKVETRIRALMLKIQKATDEIKLIQLECDHPPATLTEKFGGNTGNYDPSADCYWVDRTCGVCCKFWTTFSNEPGYYRDRSVK
jgi:hypothetical protein